MSWLSSIFNPSTGTPVNGGGAVPAPAPAPAPAVPPPEPAPAAPANPTSPLDEFKKLWENPTTADGKPAPLPVDPLASPLFTVDPAKITESAGKMDFLAGVSPENITKALSGDATAFADVINQAVRQAVIGVTVSNSTLVNNAIGANNQRVTAALPDHIKKQQLLGTPDENPIFNHPAAQPLVQSLKQIALTKNPNASVAEINQTISNFLTSFGKAVVETSPEGLKQQQQRKAGEGQDWNAYLE